MYLKLIIILSIIKLISTKKEPEYPEIIKTCHNPTYDDEVEVPCLCSDAWLDKPLGDKVTNSGYEWVVGVYSLKLKKVVCTGLVLSNNTILSPAHCLDEDTEYKIIARYFHSPADHLNSKDYDRKVNLIKFHPHFRRNRPGPSKYDLAILHVNKDFYFGGTANIFPGCIYLEKVPKLKTAYYYYAGYSFTHPNYHTFENFKALDSVNYTEGLRWVRLKYDEKSCQGSKYKYWYCLLQEHDGVCGSLPGGPVHVYNENTLLVVGILTTQHKPAYNKNVSSECSFESGIYFIKLINHLDFILKEGKPKCTVVNKKKD